MSKIMSKRIILYLIFLVVTLLYFILTHYIALFAHEWTHGTVAWIFGYKSNPFNIYYGIDKWKDLIIFPNVDEAVNYLGISFSGHPYIAGIIAITPPVITNGGLFLVFSYLSSFKSLQKRPWLYYFIFWLVIMNLGNWLDYIPVRTFSTHADIGNFIKGFGMSPWWVYIIGTYILIFFLWHFFKIQIPRAYEIMNINSTAGRAILLFIVLVTLFYFFGGTGRSAVKFNYTCNVISYSFIAAIPLMMFFLWPSKKYHL